MDGLVPLPPPILGIVQVLPAGGAAGTGLERLALQSLVEATLLEALPNAVRLQLPGGQELLAQGQLPFPPGSQLSLQTQPLPNGAGLRLQVIRATPPPADPVLAPLVRGEAGPLLARLQAAPESLRALAERFQSLARPEAPESPETWSSWIKATVRALADPATSPQEAPFHQLQAREGTALFEVPLPWAPQDEPLRLWVESDASRGGGSETETRRVFLSVAFSSLGPVRMGVERGPAGIRARIWVEDPERLSPLRSELEAQLSSQGAPATVRILPLPDPAPDLRAMAGAPPLAALG
jgi:hypothetical protein